MEIAAAAVAENPDWGHTPALREFASLSLKDSETGVHRAFRKYGLAADLPLRKTVIGPGPLAAFPYLKFSDWVRYLVERKQLGQLCGTNDVQHMNVLLSEFWRRYKLVEPDYELWALEKAGKIDLRFCLPIYSHTDEGRTLKKRPVWILSCHGALGTGTSKSKRNVPVPPQNIDKDGMCLNFSGNTWGTQFLVSVMTRHMQNSNPGSMEKIVAFRPGHANAMFARNYIQGWIVEDMVCSYRNKGGPAGPGSFGELRAELCSMPKGTEQQDELYWNLPFVPGGC